jgi:hypothetical protein
MGLQQYCDCKNVGLCSYPSVSFLLHLLSLLTCISMFFMQFYVIHHTELRGFLSCNAPFYSESIL